MEKSNAKRDLNIARTKIEELGGKAHSPKGGRPEKGEELHITVARLETKLKKETAMRQKYFKECKKAKRAVRLNKPGKVSLLQFCSVVDDAPCCACPSCSSCASCRPHDQHPQMMLWCSSSRCVASVTPSQLSTRCLLMLRYKQILVAM